MSNHQVFIFLLVLFVVSCCIEYINATSIAEESEKEESNLKYEASKSVTNIRRRPRSIDVENIRRKLQDNVTDDAYYYYYYYNSNSEYSFLISCPLRDVFHTPR